MAHPVILASASRIRLELLLRAGVAATAEAASIDEGEIKAAFQSRGLDVEDCAETLARLKAQRISDRRPAAYVIGADQMLDCDSGWYDKPNDLDQARQHLKSLRGKTHRLVTSAVVLRGGHQLWRVFGYARLTMRPFSDAFLDEYLQQAGPAVLSSVGAYQLEGLGAQLFEKVEGDYFTVLGLPLLPLLDFLRGHGVIQA